MHRPWTLLTLLLTLSPMAMAQEEEFTFDAEEFEPKVFEFSGYIEGEPEYARANRDGALYQLQFFGRDPDKIHRPLYRHPGAGRPPAQRHRQPQLPDPFRGRLGLPGRNDDHALYQGYLSLQPDPGFAVDLGKKAIRWGKGYAWNPVAFVERAKDAGDPDLSREGYWISAVDWVNRFDGPLQTLALTPLISARP